MPCCYCETPGGVTIRIGRNRYAHRACFVEQDKRDEIADLGVWMPAPRLKVRLAGSVLRQNGVPCACGCGEVVPARVGHGPKSPYVNENHWRRAYKAARREQKEAA